MSFHKFEARPILEKDVDKHKCMGSVGQIKTFDESDTSEFLQRL